MISGLLSRSCRGYGPHVALRGEFRVCSQVVAGSFVFLSSCDGDLRECLMLPQGSQACFEVVRVTSGLLSSRSRGIRLHLKMRQDTQGSYPVATGISEFLPSFNWEVRPHLIVRHGRLLSSGDVNWVSGLLSSSGRKRGLLVEVQQGS